MKHGTNSTYCGQAHCRCQLCTSAHSDYNRRWRAGELRAPVDAAPLRSLVLAATRDSSWRRVAMRTGCDIRTLREIATGRTERVQWRTAAKLARLVSA